MNSPQIVDQTELIAELRRVGVFSDLTDDDLAWLAEQATMFNYDAGEVVGVEGEPAHAMYALIYGELRAKREQREHGAADSWLFVWKAGDIAGTVPYSRMTHWPVTSRAVVPTRLAKFPTALFPEMLQRIPVLVERLVHIMVDRARMGVRDEEQNQSLLALGKIAAGLAHELYNPTTAVLRGARELRQRLSDFRRSSLNLAQHNVHDDALRVLTTLHYHKPHNIAILDPIARSERLDQLGEWLDDRHVEHAWSLAESFLEASIDVSDLERLALVFPDEALSDALVWLDAMLGSDSLIQDVESAATRVAGLVDSVKSYSYMDRLPDKSETDIHAALESTLTILTHKLRSKSITVERQYDSELPRVVVNAGELNQVWTNLLDNAIDAVNDGGRITVRTTCEPVHVLIEIADNGHGIPAAITARIWEPFFTTRDVGKGTGLGLDIVRRIVVRRHQGEITVRSEPGETRFQVRLPLVS
jgi:signal transduction histidine kinase